MLSRRPQIRGRIALAVASLCLLGVAGVDRVARRPAAASAVVVVVVGVLSVGGPASAVGFMLARDYNPRHRISTATGMVNVGGFCGAVVMVFAVGQILDFVEPGAATHSLAAFRWALAAIALLTAFGIFRMVTWLLRTRVGVLLCRRARRGCAGGDRRAPLGSAGRPGSSPSSEPSPDPERMRSLRPTPAVSPARPVISGHRLEAHWALARAES